MILTPFPSSTKANFAYFQFIHRSFTQASTRWNLKVEGKLQHLNRKLITYTFPFQWSSCTRCLADFYWKTKSPFSSKGFSLSLYLAESTWPVLLSGLCQRIESLASASLTPSSLLCKLRSMFSPTSSIKVDCFQPQWLNVYLKKKRVTHSYSYHAQSWVS